MDLLTRSGVETFGVNLHHLPEVVRATVNGSGNEARVRFAEEPEILGTGGGITNLWRKCFPDDEYLVVVNGDGLYGHFPLTEMISRLRESDTDAVIAVLPNVVGTTLLGGDEEGLLTGRSTDPSKGWTYIGLQVIHRHILDRLPSGAFHLFNNGYLPLIDRGEIRVVLYHYEGFWCEAGTPAQYLNAQFSLLAHGDREAVPSTSRCDGKAMTVIHKDASIHPEARLDHAVVGRGASVGTSVRLSRCLVLPDAEVEEGSYTGTIFYPGGHITVIN